MFYECGADALLMAKQPSAGEQEQAGKGTAALQRTGAAKGPVTTYSAAADFQGPQEPQHMLPS
jgi:hypothetical protein